MDSSHYCHTSTGIILYDPGIGTHHFDPWFALLTCDQGIIDYLSWFMERHGLPVHKGSRWGAHVTFVRCEEPPNRDAWGKYAGEEVPFHYTHVVHWTNGWHAWVDVWCPRLTEIRQELGLVAKTTARYHLALGRLVVPLENVKNDYGDPTVL
jgi:hypothetical protein